MNKLISRALCVVMLLSLLLTFAACGVSGHYELKEVSYSGLSLSAKEAGFDTENYYIDLNANGTAVMCMEDEKQDMEWKDGQIWAVGEEDAKADFEIDDDELILEIEGMEMVFEKK